MKISDAQRWIEILKAEDELGIPDRMFDSTLDIEGDNKEIRMSLQIAKFITELIPSRYKDALQIYLDVLDDDGIEDIVSSRKDNSCDDIIEMIIWACLDVASMLSYEENDKERGIQYIEKGIKIMKQCPVKLFYISKGEIYYTYWRMLEQSDKKYSYTYLYDEIDKMLK